MQPVTATGVKGFLQWFAQDQPYLYRRIAPQLPTIAPRAFSNYSRRLGKMRAIYKTGYAHRVGLGALSDYDTLPEYDVTASPPAPITVDYTTQLTAPGYTASGVQSSASYTTLPTDSSGNVLSSSSASVAGAANSGPSDASTISAIGNSISSLASQFLNAANMAALVGLVSSQLNRAQSGNTPSGDSSSSRGVPVVTGASSSTKTLLLLAALGVGAYLVMEHWIVWRRRRRNPKTFDVSSVEGMILVGGVALGAYVIYQVFNQPGGVSGGLPAIGQNLGTAIGNAITSLGQAIQAPFNAWEDAQQ